MINKSYDLRRGASLLQIRAPKLATNDDRSLGNETMVARRQRPVFRSGESQKGTLFTATPDPSTSIDENHSLRPRSVGKKTRNVVQEQSLRREIFFFFTKGSKIFQSYLEYTSEQRFGGALLAQTRFMTLLKSHNNEA